MDLAHAVDFVRDNHHAVLATRAPTGLQTTPVLAGVAPDGRLVVSSRETAYKTKNLRRDPWAQLCVLPDQFFGSWVWIEGSAEVVALPEAMDLLVGYYRDISGETDWDAYRAAMVSERRVAIMITPIAAGPNRQG